MNLGGDEERILGYWKENETNSKVRNRNRGKKPFYFLDGPPFVSGDLHPGQMWVKANKDIVVRYKRMRGFDVYDRSGYDVHGLPIENRVENMLKISSKKEIESIGIDVFIKHCKEYVGSYIGRMDADYARFGISLDFSNPYNPSDNSYMETEWAAFKTIYEKKRLYESKRTTPYCPHCETVVAQGSMEVEYNDDTDPSLYLAFKIDGRSHPKVDLDEEAYLLVWTTTPWTIPANIAVMANPKELYVMAKIGGKNLIVAKSRLDRVVAELGESAIVLKEFYGSEMEGIGYFSPLEAQVPLQKKFRKYHKVVFAEQYVSMNEGTGLVHCSPGHGLEDFLVGKANKLPIFSPVDSHACYTEEAGLFGGLKVPAEANKKVLEALESAGAVLKIGAITHSYPHCWRCKSKIIQIATDQWFINIQKIKKKLVSENRKVIWQPQEAQKWQEDVLLSSPDWCISRQRYWGTPIPIWRCKCGTMEVIGSKRELAEKANNKAQAEGLADLHRPYVDAIKLKCKSCGEEMERVKDILDVWFDSGIAFRASLTEQEFTRFFPVDFVAEAIEQLRGWFSCMLKISTIVYGKKPFTHVFTHAMMLDTKGKPMHKSLGNFVELGVILKSMSADAFRLHCLSHVPQMDFPFGIETAKEAEKTTILLRNVSKLLGEYCSAAGYIPLVVKRPSVGGMGKEDSWIVSRMNATIEEVTTSLDAYQIYRAVAAIKSFVTEEFSRFYLKYAKKAVLSGSRAKAKKTMDIVNYVLFNTVLLFAPIIPFSAESIYLEHFKGRGESVFLEAWPKANARLIDKEVEGDFAIAMETITAILNAREKANVKLRAPIMGATIETSNTAASTVMEKLSGMIEEYTNIKHLAVVNANASKMVIKPLFQKLGPVFKGNAQLIGEELAKQDAQTVDREVSTNGSYPLRTGKGIFNITSDHFVVMENPLATDAIQFAYGTVSLDTAQSEELKEELVMNELVRKIQMMRKEMGLSRSDRIALAVHADNYIEQIMKKNAAEIKRLTNASALEFREKEASMSAHNVEGAPAFISIVKS